MKSMFKVVFVAICLFMISVNVSATVKNGIIVRLNPPAGAQLHASATALIETEDVFVMVVIIQENNGPVELTIGDEVMLDENSNGKQLMTSSSGSYEVIVTERSKGKKLSVSSEFRPKPIK